MANLLPEGYENEVVLDEDRVKEGPIGYRNGVAFDYEHGDFKRDGRNRLLDSDGIESWRSWCINAILTERYSFLAYSSDFGVEWETVFRAESKEEAESIATRQITECLLADQYKRTRYVEDISYNWIAPDSVEIHATVQGIDDVTIDLIAYLTR